MLSTFEVFGRARYHGKIFLKLCPMKTLKVGTSSTSLIWNLPLVWGGGGSVTFTTKLQLMSTKLQLMSTNLLNAGCPQKSFPLAGKELSLSSWCIASYIYHFSTVIDFSSEKYSGSTGHRNSWYQ